MSLPNHKATYNAIARACSLGTAKTGTKQVAVTFEVVSQDEHQGETIAWIGSMTDKTWERTIESLQHCGWQGDDLTELADLDADGAARLLSAEVQIVCEPEADQDGNDRLRVKWVNKPGAGRFAFKAKLEGAELRSFAAEMKNSIRGMRAGGGQAKKPAQTQTKTSNGGGGSRHPNAPGGSYGSVPPDDDIPFMSADEAHETSAIARRFR